jgi:hypothetical protein
LTTLVDFRLLNIITLVFIGVYATSWYESGAAGELVDG